MRDADEEWYAKEHSNGPTEAEGSCGKPWKLKFPTTCSPRPTVQSDERFSRRLCRSQRGSCGCSSDQTGDRNGHEAQTAGGLAFVFDDAVGRQLAEITGLTGLQPLVRNAEFARQLLHEHLQALKDMQKDQTTHKKGAFLTDVAGALGTDAEEAVKQLPPTFRALCEYRSTMLRVKQMELEQSQQLQLVTDAKGAQADKEALDELKQLTAERSQWKIYAQRLIDAGRGRLRQLYLPQPYLAPLRIAAPPRVGKSACATPPWPSSSPRPS